MTYKELFEKCYSEMKKEIIEMSDDEYKMWIKIILTEFENGEMKDQELMNDPIKLTCGINVMNEWRGKGMNMVWKNGGRTYIFYDQKLW